MPFQDCEDEDDEPECEGCGCSPEFCECDESPIDSECDSVAGHGARAPNRLAWSASCVGPMGRPRLGYEFECDAVDGDHIDSALSATTRAYRSHYRNALGYMIAKEDGSLHGDCPVEFCTVPCTSQEHARVLWTAFPDGRFGSGVRSWSNGSCGMHVHISRSVVSRLSCGKAVVFMNHGANAAFIHDIAGRRPNGYCSTDIDAAVSWAMGQPDDFDRYRMFNLANRATYEVRIFRPSTKVTSILKNIEFVEALMDYVRDARICATTNREAGDLSFQSFLQWLASDGSRKKYAYLSGWLLARVGAFGDTYRMHLRKNVKQRGDKPKRGFPELPESDS